MIKIINLVITVPLTLFVLLFAVSNTQDVTVSLNLIGLDTTLPLYIISLGLMAAGFICGCVLVWLNLYGYRIKYWSLSRKNAKLEGEIENLKSDLDKEKNHKDDPQPYPKTENFIKLSTPSDSDEDDQTPYYDR